MYFFCIFIGENKLSYLHNKLYAHCGESLAMLPTKCEWRDIKTLTVLIASALEITITVVPCILSHLTLLLAITVNGTLPFGLAS